MTIRKVWESEDILGSHFLTPLSRTFPVFSVTHCNSGSPLFLVLTPPQLPLVTLAVLPSLLIACLLCLALLVLVSDVLLEFTPCSSVLLVE